MVRSSTMGAGAIVETNGRADLEAVAARHRIRLTGPVGPWCVVRDELNLRKQPARLLPAYYAEAMSRERQGTVIAFFVQATASVEQTEHREKGVLVRERKACEARDRRLGPPVRRIVWPLQTAARDTPSRRASSAQVRLGSEQGAIVAGPGSRRGARSRTVGGGRSGCR
jgi:hypothetical protein